MLDKIVIENSIINPFYRILDLFFNEAINNEKLSQDEYIDKLKEYEKDYNIEWLNKNIDSHYQKLLNTTLNILKVQKQFKENKKIDCIDINWEFTMQNWLEYFYIKKSTLIELTDLFYEKYFNLKFKNKREREQHILNEFKKYMGEDVKEFRDKFFKKEILEVRNRIIHDNGYSIKIYKMDDNIFTFQIYDFDLNEVKKVNEIYSYYPLNGLDIRPPLIILEMYVTYSLVLFILYVEIFLDFFAKKANINFDNLKKYKEIVGFNNCILFFGSDISILKENIEKLKVYFQNV